MKKVRLNGLIKVSITSGSSSGTVRNDNSANGGNTSAPCCGGK